VSTILVNKDDKKVKFYKACAGCEALSCCSLFCHWKIRSEGNMFYGMPSGRPLVSVDTYWRDISILSGGISIKPGTNIRHV